MKNKIFDNITKPIYRDSDGTYLTALQKYEMEHTEDYAVPVSGLSYLVIE